MTDVSCITVEQRRQKCVEWRESIKQLHLLDGDISNPDRTPHAPSTLKFCHNINDYVYLYLYCILRGYVLLEINV